jgi:hypothetical protein
MEVNYLFTSRCLYYLLCSASTLAFFTIVGKGSPHIYIPTSVSIGILLGIGLQQSFKLLTWRLIQDWLIKILLPPQDQPILPSFRSGGTRP